MATHEGDFGDGDDARVASQVEGLVGSRLGEGGLGVGLLGECEEEEEAEEAGEFFNPTPGPSPNGRGGTMYTATQNMAQRAVMPPLPLGEGPGGGLKKRPDAQGFFTKKRAVAGKAE